MLVNTLGDDIILNDVIARICSPDNLSLRIIEVRICEGLLYINNNTIGGCSNIGIGTSDYVDIAETGFLSLFLTSISFLSI